MRSILSNEYKCYVCGYTGNLHVHHIFFGTANRKLSERYGCWVYLCPRHHNMSRNSVHEDACLDKSLKKHCQEVFEKHYNVTTERFIEIFGRNYK